MIVDERIWSLHCAGESVGGIAEKLGKQPDAVRYSITERWRAEKEEASENRKSGSGGSRSKWF